MDYRTKSAGCRRVGCRNTVTQSAGKGRPRTYCSNACRAAGNRAAPALKKQRELDEMTETLTRRAMRDWGDYFSRPVVAALVEINRRHGYAAAAAAFQLAKLAVSEDARQRDRQEFQRENPNWNYGDGH